MKFKPLILFNPKNKNATFAFADEKKIRKSTLAPDTLQKTAKTTYSPFKKISVKTSRDSLKVTC